MKAIIPAAGYATRMYPLTENTPKTLLKVSGKPILEHIIARIEKIPVVNEILIVTNSKFFQNFLDWKKNFECRIPIKILDDKTTSNENRLGSIGDINFVISSQKICEEIVSVNSDNLFSFDLLKPYAFFRAKKSDVICAYDTKSIEEAKKMGAPELDANCRVIGFVEKPPEPKTTLSSVGIYFYSKETVLLFKKYLEGGNSPDKTGEFIIWLHKIKPVYAFVFAGKNDKWFDIGSIEAFEEAQKEFPKFLKN